VADRRIAGTSTLTVDGRAYRIGDAIKVSIDAFEREGVVGLSGVGGYIERNRVPFIEATVLTDGDFSTEELNAITDATVKVDLANGKSYVLRNAWSAMPAEIDAAAGTCPVRFEGMQGKEL
jgi:hypothetical protein